MSKHKRDTDFGPEYSDGECWMNDSDVCNHCRDQCEAEDKPFQFAEARYSFGYYAGRYCDPCWKNSGYRDADDPDAEFSEADAGESLHGEDDAWSEDY